MKSLQEITTRIGDGLHGTPKYDDSGDYYFINGNNLSQDKIILKKETRRVSKEEYLKHKKDLNDRTLLVSINGTLGNFAFYNNEMVMLGKSACYLNLINDVDKEYIGYLLKNRHFQKYIDSNATGTTIKNVSLQTIRNYEFELPPKRNQQVISNFLSSFDQKIKLSQKMNETLEEIAKTLFKSWFIDFDPVRAKAEGRPTGLSKEISDLFPNSFEESELGEIPKGWQIANLDALTSKLTTGLNPRKNFVLGSGENFYVTIKNLGDLDVILDDKCDKVDKDAIKKINSRSDLKKDDILFSGIGTIGKVVYVYDEPKNWNISESVFSLRANSESTFSSFLYQLLKSYTLQGYVDALASGSVQRGIRMGSLKEYKFALSNLEVQQSFNKSISPLIEKISFNLKETKILIDLRDVLLPKLISGELKIPDLENLVEEAGI